MEITQTSSFIFSFYDTEMVFSVFSLASLEPPHFLVDWVKALENASLGAMDIEYMIKKQKISNFTLLNDNCINSWNAFCFCVSSILRKELFQERSIKVPQKRNWLLSIFLFHAVSNSWLACTCGLRDDLNWPAK